MCVPSFFVESFMFLHVYCVLTQYCNKVLKRVSCILHSSLIYIKHLLSTTSIEERKSAKQPLNSNFFRKCSKNMRKNLIFRSHKQQCDGTWFHLREAISFHRDPTTQPTGPTGSNIPAIPEHCQIFSVQNLTGQASFKSRRRTWALLNEMEDKDIMVWYWMIVAGGHFRQKINQA